MKIRKPSRLVAFFFPWRQRAYEQMLAAKRASRKCRRRASLKTIGSFFNLRCQR